jgi:AcrR family transcriptional regulator
MDDTGEPQQRSTADHRGDERRARIIEGAVSCFVRYGVTKTTIDDVASAVRLSRRTIYRYFENKNELFAAVVSHELEELSRESRVLYQQLPFADALVEVTMNLSSRVNESPTLSGLFAASTASESFQLLFGEQDFLKLVHRYLDPYIREAKARGDLRAEIEVGDAVEWVTHVAFSLIGPNAAIRKTDEQHVRSLLRTFLLPGLTGRVSPGTEPASVH